MRITIAQRLRPYSHLPGTSCLLPGTSLRIQIYPTLLSVDDLSGPFPVQLQSLPLKLSGPARDFTVQQDLEKGILIVWGHYQEGYLRYVIKADGPSSFAIILQRSPADGVVFGESLLHPGDSLPLEVAGNFSALGGRTAPCGRLSLGSHKAQDWELVRRRLDLKEILPIWYRLGRCTPAKLSSSSQGTLQLLASSQRAIQEKRKLEVCPALLNLFRAGFEGILSPRLIDSQHQGFHLPDIDENGSESPLALLTEGAELIGQLFLQVRAQEVHILPLLPPEFHCGRMTGIDCGGVGALDMEWSKKTIRRLVFRSHFEGPIHFRFQKQIKQFRLRHSRGDKGQILDASRPIQCESGKLFLFDRFTK